MDAFFIFCAKYLFILPVLILGGYFLLQDRSSRIRMTLFAAPALILSYLLGLLGGRLFYDPRPFVSDHITPLITHAANNGFPSDHTLLVATLATIGTYWDKKLGILLWMLALLVAIARVYVGVHHIIDVVGSTVIAVVAVSLIYLLSTYVRQKAY